MATLRYADTASITDWSFVQESDLEIISAPIDGLCLNYYQPDLVGAATPPRDDPHGPYPGGENVAWHRAPGPRTDMDWPIDPSGLEEVLRRSLARLHRTPRPSNLPGARS